MQTVFVECLRCGAVRHVERADAGECPRCGYVGWAATTELTEPVRRLLRDLPLHKRRLKLVA